MGIVNRRIVTDPRAHCNVDYQAISAIGLVSGNACIDFAGFLIFKSQPAMSVVDARSFKTTARTTEKDRTHQAAATADSGSSRVKGAQELR